MGTALNWAWPLTTGAVPSTVLPSWNVTFPVGTVEVPLLPTVAVRTKADIGTEGLDDEARVVVVACGAMVKLAGGLGAFA
jgi:hypothetical protein